MVYIPHSGGGQGPDPEGAALQPRPPGMNPSPAPSSPPASKRTRSGGLLNEDADGEGSVSVAHVQTQEPSCPPLGV